MRWSRRGRVVSDVSALPSFFFLLDENEMRRDIRFLGFSPFPSFFFSEGLIRLMSYLLDNFPTSLLSGFLLLFLDEHLVFRTSVRLGANMTYFFFMASLLTKKRLRVRFGWRR